MLDINSLFSSSKGNCTYVFSNTTKLLIDVGVSSKRLVESLEKNNIKPEEIMAFGDARNDLELLSLAGYGFVMANGTDFMKHTIGRVAPLTNEEDGELAIIEEYFNNPKSFLEKYKL